MSEAFEEIIAALLEADGYWVKRNIKIQLSTSQRQQLALKSRACELDIVAVHMSEPSEVLIVECKGFARSGGVDLRTFSPSVPPTTRRHRYKLFWDPALRGAVTSLLQSNGITPKLPHVYALASSATTKADHPAILKHLVSGGMRLLDRAWILQRLQVLGVSPTYQNTTIAALASLYHHPKNPNYL